MGDKRCTLKPPIPSLFLPFLLLHNQFNLFFAATHTLTAGQCIRDGSNQTLVSHGGIFELGFFSPGQSKNRYIGTWYHGLPTQAIVWVANRANPVVDSSGILCLVADGDLALIDSTNATIWSTNIRMKSNSVSATLSDSGNLIHYLQNESYQQFTLWESFNYPSDTYLPGMRAGLDSTTGTNQLLTSWKSEDDPSIGNYSIGINPRGPPQMFIWEGSTPRWRSGLWNGQSFLGMPTMLPLHYVVTENKMYFSYAPLNSSLEMFVLSPNGIYEQRSWDKNQNGWNSTWHAPGSECENYNKCGDYAICNDEDTIICGCLPGFEPKITGKWNGGDWSGGCVRSTPLQCDEKEDEFVRVDGVKLPDSSIWIGSIDEKGCEIKCLRNCSCKAYSYANGIGCLVWRDALMDIQQFASGGEGIYVRIVGNASAAKEKKVPSHIIVELTLGLILLILTSYVLCKCQDRSAARKKMADILNLELRIDNSPGSASILVALNAKKGKLPDFPLFNLRTLATATNDFHLSNKLGQGGFGPVYKGKLPSSQEIAVKRLSKSSGQGMEQFKNEVISIAKLQHENLVKLLGFCIEGGEKILVYEYMPNRSLDAFLFDPTKKGILDWKKRFNVIRGIARGLLYVHRDSRLRVVHRDLKASNILLDENMNPKISDFGMAKIFGGDQDEGKTTRVAGTFGYMSPEYAMEGHFSMKSDVYSFGVLLLEIISGERNGTFRNFKNCKNLLEYAWKIWQEDRAMDFMDVCIRRNCAAAEVLKCIQVGLLCVQDNAADRPTMGGVVYMLGREPTSLLIPKKPQFNPTGNFVEMDSSECHLNTKDIPYSTMRER